MPRPSIHFAFDHTSPEAERYANERSAALLSTLADREPVRGVVGRAFSEHMTPQAAASLIRSVVGLTGPQTQAMLNLRSLLDPTSPTYAGDGALVYAGKTAIRIPEDGFDADMIDQRVEEYSDRLLNQRARMIARTELIGASNAGTQEAWQQAVDEGLLTGGERREWMWVEGLDKVPCPTCSEMDGQRVELDAPFISPDGEEIMNPPAHPNCRCGQGLVTEAERQQEVADQPDEEASLETADAFRELGGPGSGNFGHAGRPGEVGGSSEGDEHLTVENRIGDKAKMFVAAVQGQLSAIPADMRLAGGASSNAIIRDRPKNVPSTAQAHFQAIGGGSPSGYIYLYPRRGDDPVEVAGNAVHEYGHAVDLHLGGGKFWSDDPEFGAALKKDAATLNDKDRHWVYSHVISSNKEAFAEAFAALAGAQGRPESNEVFQQKFPTVTAWVRGVLKRKSS